MDPEETESEEASFEASSESGFWNWGEGERGYNEAYPAPTVPEWSPSLSSMGMGRDRGSFILSMCPVGAGRVKVVYAISVRRGLSWLL